MAPPFPFHMSGGCPGLIDGTGHFSDVQSISPLINLYSWCLREKLPNMSGNTSFILRDKRFAPCVILFWCNLCAWSVPRKSASEQFSMSFFELLTCILPLIICSKVPCRPSDPVSINQIKIVFRIESWAFFLSPCRYTSRNNSQLAIIADISIYRYQMDKSYILIYNHNPYDISWYMGTKPAMRMVLPQVYSLAASTSYWTVFTVTI